MPGSETSRQSASDLVAQANGAALRAMAAGDFPAAQELLRRALLAAGHSTVLWLNLAACCRAQGDLAGALAAAEGALRSDPGSFMGMLIKGSLLERLGKSREAARLYGFAVALQPPAQTLDPETAEALRHAQRVNARYVEELVSFVSADIGAARQRGNSAQTRRINQFMDFTLRRGIIYRQEPSDFFYPGQPAIEFHEREDFPWLERLERQAPAIRAELEQILRDDFRDFVPYVNYQGGVPPLQQWAELNGSRRWGALHLYLAGTRVEQNARRCPATMAALAEVAQPQMPGRSPSALFSALQPGTRIPPHHGVANTRLVVHLPLIVPPGCGFRVGNETRAWRDGEAWVFDDTIEHEAWNNGTEPRVILIFDVWNPRLSQVEREVITGLVHAMDRFNGTTPDAGL